MSGLNPDGLGISRTLNDVTADSVNTEDATTETLAYDYGTHFPQHPRQGREFTQAPTFMPAPEVPNPILGPSDANGHPDADTITFLADPFWIVENGTLYVYAEEGSDANGAEHIGVWSGPDFNNLIPQGVVTDSDGTRIGISYPFVHKVNGTIFYHPSGDSSANLSFFKFHNFANDPTEVELVERIPKDTDDGAEHTPFYYNDRWWMANQSANNDTDLYYKDSTGREFTGGSWTEHPDSPDIFTTEYPPGGRPIVTDDKIFFFPQDTTPSGGDTDIGCWIIKDLTTSNITVTNASPAMRATRTQESWMSANVHHADPLIGLFEHDYVLFDGNNDAVTDYQIGVARVGDQATAVDVQATLTAFKRIDSFTGDTTYTVDADYFSHQFTPQKLYNDDEATLVAKLDLRCNPGTDETVDARLRDTTDSETVAEVTGMGSLGNYSSGWVEYDPINPSKLLRYRIERKNSNGVNESDIRNAVVQFGILNVA